MYKPFLRAVMLLAFAATCHAQSMMPAEQIQKDLKLTASLTSEDRIGPGAPVSLKLSLLNQSKKDSYKVVKPGDGSDVGWREPFIFYTAYRLSEEGQWEVVNKMSPIRSAAFNSDWAKDITELEPDDSLNLQQYWISSPHLKLEFQKQGLYRVFAHYRYRQGKEVKKKHNNHLQATHTMRNMPAFELRSNPVDVFVERPIDVVIDVKGKLKAKSRTNLSDLMDISLVNVSKREHAVLPPNLFRDPRLSFEIKGLFEAYTPKLGYQQFVNKKKFKLAPQEKLPILGQKGIAKNIDFSWEYPVVDVVYLRAIYNASMSDPSAIILKSDWTKVEVTEE